MNKAYDEAIDAYTKLINKKILRQIMGEKEEYIKPITNILLYANEKEIENNIKNFKLTKEDVIALVRGVEPSYEHMCIATAMGLGHYSGSYDRWDWDDAASFDKYSINTLFALYQKIKN